MPHLLLAGHFGCGNIGDDAILLGFIHRLGGEFDVTVMSGAPEETYRHYGLRSIPRRDSAAFDEELKNCDALVFPGGSVFQDVTSVGSVAYYSGLVKKAKKAGKKVALVGQGVGPVKSFFGKRMTAGAFNMADAIVCRDPQSPSTLKELGVKVPIRVGADCAFLLPEPTASDDSAGFQVGSMKAVGIAPRPIKGDEKRIIELFGSFCRLCFNSGTVPVLLEMDSKHDGPLLQEISKSQGGKVPDMRRLQTPMQLQGRLRRLDAVIAVRLHAGILASTVGVPSLMVSYDPKVSAFAKMMDFGAALNLEGLTAQRLFDQYQAFYKDKERLTKLVVRKREEMAKSAEMNIEAVLECLKLGSK